MGLAVSSFTVLADSGEHEFTFEILMYFEPEQIRQLMIAMSAAVIDLTDPESKNYLDPVAEVSDQQFNLKIHNVVTLPDTTRYWWSQVRFLQLSPAFV